MSLSFSFTLELSLHRCNYALNCCSGAVFVSYRKKRNWNAKNMASAGARVYNGGWGKAPSGVQGQSPWSGSRGAKPPEAESILTLNRANSALFLKSNASNLEQSTPVNKRRI